MSRYDHYKIIDVNLDVTTIINMNEKQYMTSIQFLAQLLIHNEEAGMIVHLNYIKGQNKKVLLWLTALFLTVNETRLSKTIEPSVDSDLLRSRFHSLSPVVVRDPAPLSAFLLAQIPPAQDQPAAPAALAQTRWWHD